MNLNEQSTFKTARVCVWIRLIHLSTWIEPQGKQDARSLRSVPAWRWWYIGPVIMGNVGDNSVSSYRLHASETQQLSYLADATRIIYLCGVSIGTAVNQWRADLPHTLATRRLRLCSLLYSLKPVAYDLSNALALHVAKPAIVDLHSESPDGSIR